MCAVFGVIGKNIDAARVTYFGLYALQHRGQESSGIASSNTRNMFIHKAMGLVPQVYTEHDLEHLPGSLAIGQNRYSTSGGSTVDHIQPSCDKDMTVILAHNGNLSRTDKIKKFLHENDLATEGLNDSEMMQKVITYHLLQEKSLEEAITDSYPLFTGAFSLLVMTKDKIAAVRDPYGIRPFCIGKLNGSGYVFSSETCALDTVSATYLRDVEPGEMVIAELSGLTSYQLAKPKHNLDIFELVYFARPDSILMGKSVYEIRKNMGRILAKESPIAADVVIPVPDSSVPAAIGYAEMLGIPFEFGLVKNRYIGRTFIMPDQRLRDKSVHMKLNPIHSVIKDKRVVVIDDSIVRGTTSKKIVKMIQEIGAKSVHFMSSCPPVRFPDFYGIDTPRQADLIGANMPIAKIQEFIGADSLHFLSYKGLLRAVGIAEKDLCTSCFTGNYPIDIGENAKDINFHINASFLSVHK